MSRGTSLPLLWPYLVAGFSCCSSKLIEPKDIEALTENGALDFHRASVTSQNKGTLLGRGGHSRMLQQELPTLGKDGDLEAGFATQVSLSYQQSVDTDHPFPT